MTLVCRYLFFVVFVGLVDLVIPYVVTYLNCASVRVASTRQITRQVQRKV